MPGLIPFFRRPAPFAPGGIGPALRSAALAAPVAPIPVPATISSSTGGTRDLVSQLNIRMYAQQLRQGAGITLQSTGDFTAKAFDRIQDHANSQDDRLRRLSSNVNSLGLTRDPVGNIVFEGATFTVRAGNQVFKLYNGRMTFGVANTPPNDSDIPNQQVSIWLDEGAPQLVFRVRMSDGSLKTGTLALL